MAQVLEAGDTVSFDDFEVKLIEIKTALVSTTIVALMRRRRIMHGMI